MCYTELAMYVRILTVLIALLFFAAQPVMAAQTGLGFVTSSGVWFSKNVFFEGETVRVMTVVVNNTYVTLTGTLGFFDGENTIAEVAFSLGFEEARQISTNWSPRTGQHTVTVRFLSLSGKKEDGTTVALNPSSGGAASLQTSTFVDVDTDRDGIGDSQDPDQDNDGLSNAEEIRRGTSVTNPDTDGDGVRDGDEVAKGADPTRKPQPESVPVPQQEVSPVTAVETATIQPAQQPTPSGVQKVGGVAVSSNASTTTTSTPFVATTTVDIAATSTALEQGVVRIDRAAGSSILPFIAYITAAIAAVFAALYVRSWSRNRE